MVNLIEGIIYGSLGFIVIIFGTVIIYKVWKNSFNYKVRIRRLTSDNTKVIKDVLGKLRTDKQKVPYMSLFFGLKHIIKKPLPNKIPIPAADVTEYDSTAGKYVVEAYYDSARGYTFIRDPTNIDTLNKKSSEEGFRVWPTGDRERMINQMYKRDSAKPKTVGEILVYMTPFITMIMILTIFMIFYGKAVQPISDMAQQTADNLIEMQTIQAESISKMDNYFRNIVAYERNEPLEQVITAPEGGG